MDSPKIYVAGHQGMVGSAIMRRLNAAGYNNIICRSHAELDLVDQTKVHDFFLKEKPDFVFLAAAKVGGIYANNNYRADFIYQNLIVQTNVIHAAWQAGVQRLLFLGSSCIYPRDCLQPIHENYLLTGPLEQTNEPYAIAKIAGIKMCESYNRQYGTHYISVMPTNLYGPNDNYNLQTSHVLPALIRKTHEAKHRNEKELIIWGTGIPKREFLYVDDLADACVFLMEQASLDSYLYNVGSGTDITIQELARLIMEIVGYRGEIRFDKSKPDGTPRKLLDINRMKNLGWVPKINLVEGIQKAYKDFLTHGYS